MKYFFRKEIDLSIRHRQPNLTMSPYIPDDVFHMIFEYGVMWSIKFRVLNKQIKSKVDERIHQIYTDKIINPKYHVVHDKFDYFPSIMHYFILHIVPILKKTPIKSVSTSDKIHLYTIAFHIWGEFKYKMRFYDCLPELFKKTFEMCKNQENYKHHVKLFYKAILVCVKFMHWETPPLSVKELLMNFDVDDL